MRLSVSLGLVGVSDDSAVAVLICLGSMLYVVNSNDNGGAVRTGEGDGAVINGGGADVLLIGVSLEEETIKVAGDGEAGVLHELDNAAISLLGIEIVLTSGSGRDEVKHALLGRVELGQGRDDLNEVELKPAELAVNGLIHQLLEAGQAGKVNKFLSFYGHNISLISHSQTVAKRPSTSESVARLMLTSGATDLTKSVMLERVRVMPLSVGSTASRFSPLSERQWLPSTIISPFSPR